MGVDAEPLSLHRFQLPPPTVPMPSKIYSLFPPLPSSHLSPDVMAPLIQSHAGALSSYPAKGDFSVLIIIYSSMLLCLYLPPDERGVSSLYALDTPLAHLVFSEIFIWNFFIFIHN